MGTSGTAAASATPALAPMLDDLLLLRLALVATRGEGLPRSRAAAELAPLFAGVGEANGSAWRERFAGAVARRTAAGEITVPKRGRLALTDAGRAAAGARFGEAGTAPGDGGSWVRVRDGLLVGLAIGRAPDDAAGIAATRGADTLRAVILLQRHAPDARMEQPTLREVVNLLATRAVRARRGTPAELRAAVLRGWLANAVDAAPARAGEAAGTLSGFAVAVLAAARTCPATLRLGDMVFVADVWDVVRGLDPSLPGLEPGADLGDFKQRLGEANAAGRLRLSRADLAGLRSPEVLAASEVRWMGATFHLIRLA